MIGRPLTVIWCERLAVAAVILRLAIAYLGDGQARIAMVDAQTVPGVGVIVLLIGIAAPPALVFWATRGRSSVAKWFFIGWITLLALGFIASLAVGQISFGPISSISLVILSLHAATVALLLARSTRRWMRGQKSAEEIAAEFS